MVLLYTEDVHAQVHNPKKYTAEAPQPEKQPTPPLDLSVVTPLMQNSDTATNTKKLMSCLTQLFFPNMYSCPTIDIYMIYTHFILMKKKISKKQNKKKTCISAEAKDLVL